MRENFWRKGAKAQSAAAFLRFFFAPLRLCVEEFLPTERFSTFRAKPVQALACRQKRQPKG